MWSRPLRAGLTAVTVTLCAAALGPVRAESGDVDIHGFLSQGFLLSSDNNYLAQSEEGSFEYMEAALNFGVDLRDDLRLGVQIFARDLGDLGNQAPELDWAYADWRKTDAFGLRAGKFKMPYGLYNETADVDAVRTSVLLPQSVYEQRLRDLLISVTGVNVYGNPRLGRGSLEYQVYGGNNSVAEDGSVAKLFNDAGAFTVRRVENDITWGSALVWNTPWTPLRLGYTLTHYDGRLEVDTNPALVGAFGFSPQNTLETDNTYFRVSSAELALSRLTVVGEYARWTGDFRNPELPVRLNQERYYGMVSFRVNDRVELGVYRSVTYPDKDDKDGMNEAVYDHQAWQKDTALSLRVDLSPNWIWKLELHDVDGTASVLLQDNPQGLEPDWEFVATKLSFAF